VAVKISYHDLGSQIVSQIAGACNYASDVVDAAGEEVSKEMVEELKATSPEQFGKYKKAWTYTRTGYCSYKVHVKKPHYRLTHLLEKGHALRNGGRSKAIPHIEPVERVYVKKFREKVEEAFNL
jgi:hypothetical protein